MTPFDLFLIVLGTGLGVVVLAWLVALVAGVLLMWELIPRTRKPWWRR